MQESATSLILEEDCTVETSIFGLTLPGYGGTTLELLSPGTNVLVMGQSYVRGETIVELRLGVSQVSTMCPFF